MKITATELALELKISPRTVRRALRNIERFDDKKYTRYELGQRDINQVKKLVDSAAPAKKAKTAAA